jgi:hypothetical protein
MTSFSYVIHKMQFRDITTLIPIAISFLNVNVIPMVTMLRGVARWGAFRTNRAKPLLTFCSISNMFKSIIEKQWMKGHQQLNKEARFPHRPRWSCREVQDPTQSSSITLDSADIWTLCDAFAVGLRFSYYVEERVVVLMVDLG